MRSASSHTEISEASQPSTDNNCQNTVLSPFVSTHFGHELKFERSQTEDLIIRTVQRWHLNEDRSVSEIDAVNIYTSKLAKVNGDPKLSMVFDEICEERKAIMIIDGGLSEAEAEAFVSSLEFLTVALMQT